MEDKNLVQEDPKRVFTIDDGSTTDEVLDELGNADGERLREGLKTVYDKILTNTDPEELKRVSDRLADLPNTVDKAMERLGEQMRKGAEALVNLIPEPNGMSPLNEALNLEIEAFSETMRNFARRNAILIEFYDAAQDMLGTKDQDPVEVGKAFTENGLADVLSFLSLVYRETHEELDVTSDGLPEANRTEIHRVFAAYLNYHTSKSATSYKDTIQDFVDTYTKSESPAQTELKPSDRFSMMLSKAALREKDIAAEGGKGMSLYVGGGVNVSATITDNAGRSIDISEIDIQIQEVIGDMVQTNGAPLNVSPAQIWRKWKGLPSSATVHQEDVDFINGIMLRLISFSGEINFAKQIEVHEGIEKQDDFDYSDPQKANIGGPMIPANYIKLTAGNGQETWGYLIYDVPLFYRYSHIVGQIGSFSTRLLTSAPQRTGKSMRQTYGGQLKTELQRKIIKRVARESGSNIVILIDEITNDLSLGKLSDRERRTIMKTVESIFDDWLSDKATKADSRLKAWDITKNGRKIVGWKLTLTPIAKPKKKSRLTKS